MNEERIAERIRELYIRERQAVEQARNAECGEYRPGPYWDGGLTVRGDRRPRIWPKIAAFSQRCGVDPEVYIPRVFASWRGEIKVAARWKTPQPNFFLSDYAVLLYREGRKAARQQLAIDLQSQRAEATNARVSLWYSDNEYTDHEALRHIIENTSLSLSPLFRVCAAALIGAANLVVQFEEAATQQYLADADLYDEVWKDILPNDFQRRARRRHCAYALTEETKE